MINIRYHVYSLVAVFLALAIGVAAGSTVVQRSVVDNLKSTQGRIEQNLDDLKSQNASLQDRTAALERRDGTLTDEGPGTFLAGELSDMPVMLVRTQGVSGGALGRVRNALKVAGAETVSEVELKPALADADSLAAVAPDLELAADQTAPEDVQAAIGERLGALVAAVHAERAPTPTTSEPSGTDTTPPATDAPPSSAVRSLTEFLQLLDDAGLASVRGSLGDAGVTTADLTVVTLGGLTRDLDPIPVVRPLLETLAAEGNPMALAADTPLDQPLGDGEEAYGAVAAVRGDGRVRDEVSTVDHVGDFAGLSALILALAALGDGQVGHYGTDEGADSLLPSQRG
jgi:hypothetical protein